MERLPPGLRRYLALLHLTCLGLMAYQVMSALRHEPPAHFGVGAAIALAAYIALSYLAEHTTLQIKGAAWQNLATTAHVGSLLLFPPPLPMLIAFIAALVSQARHRGSA
ncbi:MAG: hypothetical protein ACRDG4_06720, partial [Chloroflexota bacterium]